MARAGTHPILSCAQSAELERALLAGDEALEWAAMQRAGRGVAAGMVEDFREIGGIGRSGGVLVLAGKGHNAGDALVAAKALVEAFAELRVEVWFVFGERKLRALAARAWRELVGCAIGRVKVVDRIDERAKYEAVIDGVFGFQFRAPLEARVGKIFRAVEAAEIRLRAAVDLPSGAGDEGALRADFTYATGSVKAPVVNLAPAGRVRYLDLGFFDCNVIRYNGADQVLDYVVKESVVDGLGGLRAARCDKRDFGHLGVIGGSRGFPGAVFMAVAAAVRSGTGLVTAFVPESLVAEFAAALPEAMWVAWPETPDGGLALEGGVELRKRLDRLDALVMGPGLGREPEMLALALDVAKTVALPCVIDADALQPGIVRAGGGPRVLTPHAGEFNRIAGDAELRDFCGEAGVVTVLKGPHTRIGTGEATYHSFFGGPVLARGGSGDMLAGIVGGQLAQTPEDPLGAALRGVAWHGLAADQLARAHGQVAVRATQLLDFLPAVLRREGA